LEAAEAAAPPPQAVQVKPYYAPQEPPAMGYQVVEVKSPTPEPAADTASHGDASHADAYPVAQALARSRWSDGESRDADVRAILAKARRELAEGRRRGRPRPLERNAGECLFYPFRMKRRILRLAFVWTVVTLILENILVGPAGPEVWLARWPILCVPLFLVGTTWSFLRQVLQLAVVGDGERLPVPTLRNLAAVVQCAAQALGAFVAGPALILVAGIWFWIHAGRLERVDHWVLWQLWLCTGIGWVYLLLAVEARGRLRDAHAAAVAPLVGRQGWPGVVFPVLGGVSVTVFVYLSVQLWILSFDAEVQAFFLQFFLWCGALYFWTFALRWYGMSRYWRRQARPLAPAPGEMGKG
jgi:hypothetical protein